MLYKDKIEINRDNFFKISINILFLKKFRTKISSVESREFVWNEVENEENSFFIPYTSLENKKSFISF